MFITPQGVFKLLRNIPFNSDRKHTRLFASQSAQLQYFLSKAKYTYTNFTYVRHHNSVKVPINVEQLWDCNYVMFKNQSFGDKWFYGFITKKEYVNNTTAEIFFEVDSFQSWWFNVTMGKCFVEREHVEDDTYGLHTLPEDINVDETVCYREFDVYFGIEGDGVTTANLPNNAWYVKLEIAPSTISMLADIEGKAWATKYEANQLTSNNRVLSMSGLDLIDLNEWLNAQSLAGNEVTAMTMFPHFFITNPHAYVNCGFSRPTTLLWTDREQQPISYKPKNNKVLCYPYCYLRVSNNQGTDVDYKWEYFTDGAPQFYIRSNITNSVSCELQPSYYIDQRTRGLRIGIKDFPSVTFTQNVGLNRLMESLIGGVSNLGRAFTYNENSSYSSIANQFTESEKQVHRNTSRRAKQRQYTKTNTSQYQYSGTNESAEVDTGFNPTVIQQTPTQIIGTLGTSSNIGASVANGNQDIRYGEYGFSMYSMAIKPEYAKIVDDYFTRFGYKVSEFKIPSLHTRTSFNYVETVDCNIVGDAPDEALEEISMMFNSGLTLWHVDDVGNTDLENDII